MHTSRAASQARFHRTKIVATIGPASRAPSTLRALLMAGVDVFRLNFSHGDHASHARTIASIRDMERATGRPVAILADLQGPRIRLGKFADGEPVTLKRSERVDLVPQSLFVPARSSVRTLPLTWAGLADEVRPGCRILIADGQIELRVERVTGRRVETRAVIGGSVSSHKGINLPGVSVSIPTLTAKDRADLAFAAREGVDFLAVSFVGCAADIHTARRLLVRAGSDAQIVAKIERDTAVANLEEILDATDAVMVARGDLAVEVGHENVPILQKRILREANARAKPAITATQMLESMMENPRPTRAEASDVANAIFDGTDAVMLSGETAAGRYPVVAVRTMARILSRTERAIAPHGFPCAGAGAREREAGAIARAAVRTADDVGARLLAPFTTSGRSARLVSRERPRLPIVGFAESIRTMRRLSLYWGVRPRVLGGARTMAEHFTLGERALRDSGDVRPGDLIVFLAGASKVPGATNTLRLHSVGRR